jgi:hypothetical protein
MDQDLNVKPKTKTPIGKQRKTLEDIDTINYFLNVISLAQEMARIDK